MTTSSTVPNAGGTSTIFVGSSLDLDQMAESAIAGPLLSDGDVSFYGHMSGVVTSYENGTEQSLLSEWSGTGSGLVELTQTEPMAIMSVTIANTGTTAITLPIGTLVSSASGVQYQLVQMPRLEPGWSDAATGVGTAGTYTIQPGQSLALFAQALVDGPSGNLLANQVTHIAVPGAAITSSALITAAPQWGAGTVTLTNSSSANQIIYEGVVVKGSSGAYQVDIDPTVGGFVATDADGSSGYYVLKAGASITVPISSIATITATVANGIVQQEQAEDAAANSITGGNLPTGVSVTGSSAITTQGVVQPSDQEHVASTGANTGFFTDSADALFTTYQGYVPTEANVNTYNDYIWTKQDLVNWEAYVDNARAFGILNLAPMMSEFETVDFATSAATAYARAGALYSGGITFDMPSWFFLAREPAYQQSIEAEIRWATQNGLRSSITLSPESGDDQSFLSDTQQVVAILRAAGALPTQIVVKDGGITGGDVIYSTTDPNSLNNVGNWLSSLTLTPSNSESGLESRGSAVRPDDLMTGVQQSEVITNASAALPYALAQVFAESKSTIATVTATLGNASLGKLTTASGSGSVSANGATFTMTGTMAQLTAGLQALSFTAATGALGSTTLTTTIVDSAGTITGSTALSIDNTIALSNSSATSTATAPITTNSSILLTSASPGATLTATVTLSNPLLGSFWNTGGAAMSADGSTLTLSGTAGTLQTFLRQLIFISAPGLSGHESETISVSDGTQTASLGIAITVTAATGLAVGDLPVDIVAAPFVLDAPYQDVLVGDAGSPSQVLSATVTLPGGAATLVSPGSGSVSANGLSYSFSGTAAQLQAALRSLQLSVPASQTVSTETLSLDINGFTTTATVKTVSTDTVYVGAVDGNDSTYASSTIAAPLLATGKVGLFDDYNGTTSVAIAGTGASLASEWSGASAGVFGYGESSDVAVQTITVRNGGTAAITVPVGTLASTASGVQFQVIQYSGANANWSAGSTGDGSLGVYTIAAGASITVPVEALAQGYVGNVSAGAITMLSGTPNAVITGSTPSLLATEYAGGTITLTNSTNSAIVVNEGTLVTGANGSYVIGNDPTAADYSLRTNDSSVGIYYIPAGGSTTVPIYGVVTTSTTASLTQILAQTTSAANTVSGGSSLPAGLSITGSSAIVAVGPTTAAQGATWGNWGANTSILTDRGYGYFVTGQGFMPSEANTNLTLTTEFTAADLASWKGYVDTLRGSGIMNVAPVVTSSNAVLDISSSDATANLRSAALYGGGIDFDLPPNYLLSLGSATLGAIVDDIKWADANGLRSTMTLRAYTDPSFMENTKTLLGELQAAGALPSQAVVVGNSSTATPTNPELTNMVAQYVAGLNLAPTASESGLSTTGGSTTGSIMTGVRPAETATGTAAIAPYGGVQVFAQTSTDQMTAIVALNSTTLGTLSTSGAGTVSADGSTVTITATPASLDAALAAIAFTPAAGALGKAVLDLSITDAKGTIQGQTTIAVDDALSISGMANLSVNGWEVLQPALTITAPSSATTVTATVKLSNPALGSYWNVAGATASGNGSVTMTGSLSTVQTFLRNLVFMPTPNATGTENQTITLSDGTGTTTATATMSLTTLIGVVVSNLPGSYITAPFVTDAPYQNILISKLLTPTQILGMIVTLPAGIAKLSDSAGGTVSANGLSYSFNGTAVQMQAALRALQISVPASQTASTETLSLNINGRITTTTLDIVSTDTVYVGAVDSNDSTYASSTIAAPLLATGKVGLFDDYNGMTSVTSAGTSANLASTWSGASAGVFGYSEGSDVAVQTITVRNGGTAAITVPVGTLASTASGVQFQVIQYSGANANWSAGSTGDGSLGVYTIAAGASITVPVEALAQGYVGNVSAGAITMLSGTPNAVITGSTPSLLATEYAGGTITVTNTTGGYIIVGEGTVVTGANGSYQIGNDPTAADFTATTSDGSGGYYAIPAGGSTTLPIYGVVTTSTTASLTQILAQTTSAANTVTGGSSLPAGLSITGSSAILPVGPATAAEGATSGAKGANTGILTQLGLGYFVEQQGFMPSEANTNLTLTTEFTAADLASWKGYVDTLRGSGIMNVAPVVTSSNAVLDISSSDATANLRSAALYGGGIDFDLPPNYLLSLGSATLGAIVDDIKWADANGLRSTMTLRAYTDPSFMENTKTLLGELQAAGALPSQAVVVGNSSTATPTNPELTNMVAQYVAGLNLAPTASESGLSTTGGSTTGSIMTGVKPAETATGTAAIAPYGGVQVFAQTSTDQMTAIVALNSTTLGTLSTSGAGTVSADGSTVTITATPASLDAALAAIAFTPAAGALGKAVLDLSITDAKGTIQGQTVVSVSNPGQSAAVSVSALNAGSTATTTISVSTPASEHDVLTATAGGTVTNGTFQISGTAAADAAALAGLKVSAGTATAAPGLQIQLSGAAVDLTDSDVGHDSITSAGGNSIHTGSMTTTVAAGLGDTISAGSGSVFASGTQTFTFVGGSSAGDIVTGGAGGGSFTAGTGGHALLTAGSGTTILQAAGGNDTLVGGGGTTLYGSANNATLLHASGGDTVVGANGSSIVGPASGTAIIQAQAGNETVSGGSGAMSVTGGAGSLNVMLGTGSVSVTGGSGHETVLVGTGSHAILTDGTGMETISLQHGVATNAQLFLNGFVSGKDLITLNGYGTTAAQQLVQNQVASSSASGTVLKLSDGATITLNGISHISASDISSF